MTPEEAAARAAGPQGLWALVPATARARYLRRTAQAILDELDDLANLLALEAGMPRTEALLAELLPSVAGLHELADDGPDALADRRLGRAAVLRAGRRAVLYQAPVGVVGIEGGPASPWAEAVLEVGAALLAGNGVVLAPAVPATGHRLAGAVARAGLPDGLLQIADGAEGCERVVRTGRPGPKGTMLVLDGAPLQRAVGGALFGAFARAGRGGASIGRVVAVPSVAEALLRSLEVGARRLRVGDPRDPETDVGPLPAPAVVERVERLVQEAVDAGAQRLCGGPVGGAFFAPTVLRAVPPAARLLREPPGGPVLAVVEAASEAEAIAHAQAAPAGAVSVWCGDRLHGERIARALQADLTWVNEHGVVAPVAPVRVARHAVARRVASQPPRLRSAHWLPYDPVLVRASTASARLLHGRESERLRVLRSSAPALVRVALRLARESRER